MSPNTSKASTTTTKSDRPRWEERRSGICEPMTEAEYRKLVVAPRTRRAGRNRTRGTAFRKGLNFLFETGCAPFEMVEARFEAVDWDAKSLRAADRLIPLGRAYRLVRWLLRHRKPNQDHIFMTSLDQPWTTKAWGKSFRVYARLAAVRPDITGYALWHGATSKVMEAVAVHNIPESAHQLDLTPAAFMQRQVQGWPELDGGTLAFVWCSYRTGRGHGREMCFPESELARVRDVAFPSSSSLPTIDGTWGDDGIFWIARTEAPDIRGKPCVTWALLTKEYKCGEPRNWYKWITNSTPDLDSSVNGGKIRAFLVPNPKGPHSRPVVVWLKEDVIRIHRRRTEPQARKGTACGVWLTDKTFEHRNFGDCMPDKALAKVIVLSHSFIRYLRSRKHPALDPDVNGGKPRYEEVPRLDAARRTAVYCVADYQAIVQWEDNKTAPTVGWKNARELFAVLGLSSKDEWICLAFALAAFRRAHPAGAERVKREKRRPARYYDPVVFRKWLGARTVEQAAAPLRRIMGRTGRIRRREAVLFLQFVLTRGSFNRDEFQDFIQNPPVAPLQPFGEILSKDIKRWAKEADVETSKMLKKAKKQAGVKHRQVGRDSFWYLDSPAYTSIPFELPVRAEDIVQGGEPPSSQQYHYPGHAKKPYRTGRKLDEAREPVFQLCYDAYKVEWLTASEVISKSKEVCGTAYSPRTKGDVRYFCEIWSSRFSPPLPLDRQEARRKFGSSLGG